MPPPTTCANPLLLEWIKEIYDIARERNIKGVTTYKRAYESMRACPLTFTHPSEAVQLDGIGPKICDRLTEKLKEHCEANGLPPPKKPRAQARKRLSVDDVGLDEEAAPAKKPRKAKPYVPSLRTGPYAIIIALSSLPEDSLQGLTKSQLIELAQPHCESSFTTPSEAGKFYTAWNSMKLLLDKDLVHERGRPLRKYTLTDEGWDVARKIRAVHPKDTPTTTTGKPKKKVAGIHGHTQKTAHSSQDFDDFLDLEGASDREEDPLPHPRAVSLAGDLSVETSASSGQRLGAQPTDKYGTFSKPNKKSPESDSRPKARIPHHAPKRDFIELLSSPEPDPAPDIPWDSTSFAQDTRNLILEPNGPSIVKATAQPQPQPNTNMIANSAPNNPLSANSALTTTPPLPTFTSIILAPGTFTVHLVIDNREIRTTSDRDYISSELIKVGCPPLVRPLELGDFFWVAKLHSPTFLSQHGEEGDEIALDWIVERKRLDDLVGSITDGRFQEQKFRLRKSGLQNIVYLVEEFSLSTEKTTKFHEAIQSAIASTQVVNGYFVKQTRKLDDTIRYLARLTRMLKSLYESKPLHLIPTSALSPSTYLPLLTHLRTNHPQQLYHITYPSFASLTSKSDTLTLRDVFLKMLMCTRGISGDKALAIQKEWTTPRALVEAFDACEAKNEREGLLEGRLGERVGRGKVKGILGAKFAGVWGER